MQIGVMFGNPETTPGGKALKFYTSVRLDIRRIAQIKKIPNASFGFSVLAAIQRQFCNFGRFSTSCNVAFESIWFHVGF